MTDKTAQKWNKWLIGGVIVASSLYAAPLWAADGGRQFVPLSRSNGMQMASVNGRQFMPLGNSARRSQKAQMMPLNGGSSGRVWKLNELRDTPVRSKAKEVSDDVKLAMATGRLPAKKMGEDGLPVTGVDKEEIAAALAPVFAEELAEATEESLETDLELPKAVAAEVADAVQDKIERTLGYVWPVAEAHFRISSPFGPRTHPVTGKRDFHAGIDIPAPQGTPVLAYADGEVTAVGEHRNLGRYVKITHDDGTYSLYGHLSKWTAQQGARVSAGEKIGLVGSTGRSTGPHLDFSIRRDGKPFNPMKVLADVLEEKKLAFAQ